MYIDRLMKVLQLNKSINPGHPICIESLNGLSDRLAHSPGLCTVDEGRVDMHYCTDYRTWLIDRKTKKIAGIKPNN